MPDAHVEILLDCYKFVLQNRMLSSGRLGKGSFQEASKLILGELILTLQVADEMNRRCGLDGDGTYEREQLAAKLQNLRTQFRNRKQAVDDGNFEQLFGSATCLLKNRLTDRFFIPEL